MNSKRLILDLRGLYYFCKDQFLCSKPEYQIGKILYVNWGKGDPGLFTKLSVVYNPMQQDLINVAFPEDSPYV